MRPRGRAPARSAAAARRAPAAPRVDWSIDQGPVFDNCIGQLTFDGASARLVQEHSCPSDDGSAYLELLYSVDLATEQLETARPASSGGGSSGTTRPIEPRIRLMKQVLSPALHPPGGRRSRFPPSSTRKAALVHTSAAEREGPHLIAAAEGVDPSPQGSVAIIRRILAERSARDCLNPFGLNPNTSRSGRAVAAVQLEVDGAVDPTDPNLGEHDGDSPTVRSETWSARWWAPPRTRPPCTRGRRTAPGS